MDNRKLEKIKQAIAMLEPHLDDDTSKKLKGKFELMREKYKRAGQVTSKKRDTNVKVRSDK